MENKLILSNEDANIYNLNLFLESLDNLLKTLSKYNGDKDGIENMKDAEALEKILIKLKNIYFKLSKLLIELDINFGLEISSYNNKSFTSEISYYIEIIYSIFDHIYDDNVDISIKNTFINKFIDCFGGLVGINEINKLINLLNSSSVDLVKDNTALNVSSYIDNKQDEKLQNINLFDFLNEEYLINSIENILETFMNSKNSLIYINENNLNIADFNIIKRELDFFHKKINSFYENLNIKYNAFSDKYGHMLSYDLYGTDINIEVDNESVFELGKIEIGSILYTYSLLYELLISIYNIFINLSDLSLEIKELKENNENDNFEIFASLTDLQYLKSFLNYLDYLSVFDGREINRNSIYQN